MKIIFFLSLLLSSSSAFCLTKSEALQLTKSRLQGILPYFANLAYNCFLFEEECQIRGNSQSATLKWIENEHNQFDPKIEFDSGADKFTIDGAVRIAKTGLKWGSPVIFNEDLLAIETSPGQFSALGFFEIIGVLVHEYGHHQEEMLHQVGLPTLKHEELDEIAANVMTYLRDRTRRIEITDAEIPGLKPEHFISIYNVDIEWFNGIRNQWSRLFVDSLFETKEISQDLLKHVTCPKTYTDGHLTFSGYASSASYRKVRAPTFEFKDDALYIQQEVGEASVMCIDQQMGVFDVFRGYKDGKLNLVFLKNDPGGYTVWDRSSFTATPPPDQNGSL